MNNKFSKDIVLITGINSQVISRHQIKTIRKVLTNYDLPASALLVIDYYDLTTSQLDELKNAFNDGDVIINDNDFTQPIFNKNVLYSRGILSTVVACDVERRVIPKSLRDITKDIDRRISYE
jgi:6-phosphogluconate dehydrogenase (decarboxylating)